MKILPELAHWGLTFTLVVFLLQNAPKYKCATQCRDGHFASGYPLISGYPLLISAELGNFAEIKSGYPDISGYPDAK
ncbi:hypothetical protein PGT21_033661 [Puccinia graminis f. sp. tritici]|uniref:Uncharacterized protein n=1 Tax=Puccinia graminis f. sp. tritici TaxID=56615 RepID=A0A5B0LSE5_PUCGR|nr:hypothetical protein PGT21_033661 [Puccinia graminis f. sp. tritici]KAA1081843.1 hypothetical protein PGTUg99_016490 [Puccinia graminis f. sp. tritici]